MSVAARGFGISLFVLGGLGSGADRLATAATFMQPYFLGIDTMQTSSNAIQSVSPKSVGWLSIAMFVLWLLAIATAIVQATAFPGFSDQFVPAKIQANILAASVGWVSQIALGTTTVALAIMFSDYLATPLILKVRFALAAGIVAGVFLVAAGAGGQENIFTSVLYSPEQASQLSAAMGTPDLTVINAANNLVAGGLRSTSAYAMGWAVVLWSLTALQAKKFPAVLNWIGMISGVLYALTVWIGPLTGFPALLGFLVWYLWLGILLVRSK